MKLSIFSFFILSMLAFSSCDKGAQIDEKEKDYLSDKETDKNVDVVKDHDGKDKCFDLVYPVTYLLPDGTSVSGGQEELEAAIKAWYEAHPDFAEKPVLQYPVEVIFAHIDVPQTISNEEEMIALKKECHDELEVCVWDGSKISDTNIWEEHIIEPLVISDACGACFVSGKVKYVKIGTDFAYVINYGKGECDGWAYLATYQDGDDKIKKCKFDLDCDH